MKTDKQKVIDLFNELGIGYSESSNELSLKAKSHTKVIGYGGFVADFYFKEDGSFIEVGVWE